MTAEVSAAQGKLEPYLAKISECIDLGWKDFEKECAHIRHKTSPRSQACIVHDNIVNRAKIVFAKDENVFLYERNGTLMVQIEDAFLLRFKKLDEDKLSRGINTQERLGFLAQEELPGIQRGTNIIAGYELNALQTGIKEISIACPNGRENSWAFDLKRHGAEIVSIEVRTETEDSSAQVRAKRNDQKKSEEGNG